MPHTHDAPKTPKERRRSVRVPCRFTVGITEGGGVFDGFVENISACGLFLWSEICLVPQIVVRLSFKLPKQDDEIRVLGEVARSEATDESTNGFGIDFRDIGSRSKQLLEEFVEQEIP